MTREARKLEAAILHHIHIEMENRRDLEGTMRIVVPGVAGNITVATGERWTSREDVREFYRGFYQAIPDLQIKVRRLMVDAPGGAQSRPGCSRRERSRTRTGGSRRPIGVSSSTWQSSTSSTRPGRSSPSGATSTRTSCSSPWGSS